MISEKITNALISALSLLNNEIDSIEFEGLRIQYESVIEKLENALKEIDKNE